MTSTPVNAASSDASRFLVLDGLRGVAAFAVILDHVPSATLGAWTPGRYLAVDFFFVLSGFVLAHAYGQRLEQGRLSNFEFMKTRLIRLYPLYLLGLALGVVYTSLVSLQGWPGGGPFRELAIVAAFSLLFLPAPVFSWTGAHLYPFNGPAWSLFFELVANAFYGFIARYLTWRVLGAILIVAAGGLAFAVMRQKDVGAGWLWPHFDAGLARVIYCFFAGIAVYKLRGVVKLPAIPAWAAALVLLGIFAVPPASGFWRLAFDVFAAIVLLPLLVALASEAKVSGMTARMCATLGLLSYGVYVLHVPIMGLMSFALPVLGINVPYGFLNVALVAGVTAIVAAVATRFYDAPFRRLLTKRAKYAPKPVTAGEAG